MPAVTFADLDRPDSVWNRAAAAEAGKQADPLCCRSEWQISFHENIDPARPTILRATADSVVALSEHEDPILGSVLTPLDWSWRFGFPVLGPDGPELLQQLLREREGQRPATSVLLSALVPGSERTRRFLRLFDGWNGWLQDEQQCSVASLEGGFDGFLSRRSGLMRRNLRKAAQRAGAAGIVFERCLPRSAADAEAAYRRIVDVEARSWKGREGTGVIEPVVVGFYRRLLVRLAESGLARVVFARHGDGDIGFLFGGLAGPMFRAQQCSFANEWRAHAVGNLLQMETLRWIGEDGAQWYHMGPTMDYKLHWAEQLRTLQAVLFVPG